MTTFIAFTLYPLPVIQESTQNYSVLPTRRLGTRANCTSSFNISYTYSAIDIMSLIALGG